MPNAKQLSFNIESMHLNAQQNLRHTQNSSISSSITSEFVKEKNPLEIGFTLKNNTTPFFFFFIKKINPSIERML